MIFEIKKSNDPTYLTKLELKHFERKYNDTVNLLNTYYIYTDLNLLDTIVKFTNAYFNTILFDDLIMGKYKILYAENEGMKLPSEYYLLKHNSKALKVLVKV